MSGLGEIGGLPQFNVGAKVQPRDIDQFVQYSVINPGLLPTSLGTVTSATANAAFVFDNITLDYPRNVLVSILGVAGGMGGTVTLAGKDQFGGTQTETLGFASANAGGSVAGTKIFSMVNAATLTGIAGLGGTAIGTARIGYAVGTAAGIAAKIGFPVKVGSFTDLRNVARSGQGVGGTSTNGGTITTGMVDTTNHAFNAQAIIGGSETYTFTIVPTYDNAGRANLTTR